MPVYAFQLMYLLSSFVGVHFKLAVFSSDSLRSTVRKEFFFCVFNLIVKLKIQMAFSVTQNANLLF